MVVVCVSKFFFVGVVRLLFGISVEIFKHSARNRFRSSTTCAFSLTLHILKIAFDSISLMFVNNGLSFLILVGSFDEFNENKLVGLIRRGFSESIDVLFPLEFFRSTMKSPKHVELRFSVEKLRY